MTRVVVIGPYPPSPDPAADEVLAVVRELRAAGHGVEVVSPEPSAAAHHGDPRGWRGARRVARVARGADRVVWVGAADGVTVPAPLRRALAAVGTVEHRPATVAPPPPPGGASPRERVARVRAGAPTLVRTLAARIRSRAARARSARRGPPAPRPGPPPRGAG